MIQEFVDHPRKLRGVLIQKAMARIGEEMQMRIRVDEPLIQHPAVHRRHEKVIAAVRHQHRDPDLVQTIVAAFLPVLASHPPHDRLDLPLRPFRAHIVRAIGPRGRHAFPPLLTPALLLVAPREKCSEEAIVLIFFRGRAGQHAEILGRPRLGTWALARPAAGDDELPDHVWSIQRDELGHKTAHGESEDVHLGNVQSGEDGDDVLCPGCEGWGHFSATVADAGVVDEDDGARLGDRVDEVWIPMVHRAAEMDVEDERGVFRGSGAEVAVGELDTFDNDMFGFSCLVGRHDEGMTSVCSWNLR